jgi:integrase/recombinase XerD
LQETAAERDREHRLERSIEDLKTDPKVLPANRKLILDFLQASRARSVGPARQIVYVYKLKKLSLILNKDFRKTTVKDMEKAIAGLETTRLSEWTKHTFKAVVKRFYQWLRGLEDEYPPEVKWIKLRLKNEGHMLPEELLTEEEVKRLAEAAEHPRDRAFVLTLYESGCRVGEILSLRIKHVQFDKYGAVLIVNGKTGMRRVRVIASSPAIATWMNNHPNRDQPNAPLWTLVGTRNHGQEMDRDTAANQIRSLARKIGLKKRVNPHMFRHSRASHLANVMTEAQMKTYLGWVPGSDMASVYVHLSGRDVDKALLQMNGIVQDGEKPELVLKVLICPRCNQKSDPTSRFCQKCGLPLELKAGLEIEEARSKADEIMSKLLEDPDVKDFLEQKLRHLKLT